MWGWKGCRFHDLIPRGQRGAWPSGRGRRIATCCALAVFARGSNLCRTVQWYPFDPRQRISLSSPRERLISSPIDTQHTGRCRTTRSHRPGPRCRPHNCSQRDPAGTMVNERYPGTSGDCSQRDSANGEMSRARGACACSADPATNGLLIITEHCRLLCGSVAPLMLDTSHIRMPVPQASVPEGSTHNSGSGGCPRWLGLLPCCSPLVDECGQNDPD